MDTTSLPSRGWGDEDERPRSSRGSTSHTIKTSNALQRATALLRFVELTSTLCVGVSPELPPIRHLETIGEGLSFSVKGHPKSTEPHKVLKVFKSNFSEHTSDQFDQHGFEDLMLETHILGFGPVNRDPNVVKLRDVSYAIQSLEPLRILPVLILERAEFGNMNTFQASEMDVDWQNRKFLCHDIASGLDALHRCGIVHGDVKAENVLIFRHPRRKYTAKLSDFGCSVILPTPEARSASNHIRLPGYTPPWNAPEAKAPIPADLIQSTDIYSLGLLMWKTLVHHDPFLYLDLPPDKSTRLREIQNLLSVPEIGQVIQYIIADEIGLCDMTCDAHVSDLNDSQIQELAFLAALFSCTVCINPLSRSLKRALDLLAYHSTGLTQDPTVSRRSYSQIPHLPTKLEKISASMEFFTAHHHVVQRQMLLALQEIAINAPKSARDLQGSGIQICTQSKDVALLRVFECYLRGVGSRPNVEAALNILYSAGRAENGLHLKSIALTPVLYHSLQIPVPEASRHVITAMKLYITYDGWFTRRFLDLELPSAQPDPAAHGIIQGEHDIQWLTASDFHTPSSGKTNSEDLRMKVISQGNTLLHCAALHGQLKAIEYLIESVGVDVNVVNDRRETALMIACRWGHYDAVRLLLDNEADASIENSYGENGLHWLNSFAEAVRPTLAERLHSSGASLQGFRNYQLLRHIQILTDRFIFDGRSFGSPLLRAISHRDSASLKILFGLVENACVNSWTWTKIESFFPTAMSLAAELHFYEILEYLAERLVKVLQSMWHDFELRTAARRWASSPEMLCSVLSLRILPGFIMRGALSMDQHVLRLCFHGQNWEDASNKTMVTLFRFGLVTEHVYPDNFGRTLNYAVKCGNYSVVKFLLTSPAFKAVIDHIDERNFTTPLQQAIESQQFEIFKHLIQKGATVDMRSKSRKGIGAQGLSYLHCLADILTDDLDYAKLILKCGVPPDIANNSGVSAFQFAIARGSFPLARLLLEHGMDANTRGSSGRTLLGEALTKPFPYQHTDLVATIRRPPRFLLAFGSDSRTSLFIIDDRRQMSVLHAAALLDLRDQSYPKIMEILLSHFNAPWEIGAVTNDKPTTTTMACSTTCEVLMAPTALQLAIMASNPVAVSAFIRAGADTQITDGRGRSTMDLARMSVEMLLRKQSSSTDPHETDYKIVKAQECLSLLAESGSWPEAFKIGTKVTSVLLTLKPLMDKMSRLSHNECCLRGYEKELLTEVSNQIKESGVMGLEFLEEFRRQLNQVLQPYFAAAIVVKVSTGAGWQADQHLDSNIGLSTVRSNVRWWRDLSTERLDEFQQAAAFEWLMDQIRIKTPLKELDAEKFGGLQLYAETGIRDDLPMNQKYVNYPKPLLDWYTRTIENHEVQLNTFEETQILGFIDTLRTRNNIRTKRPRGPLPAFDEAFTDFHFHLLQPERLDMDSISVEYIMSVHCRCASEKVGKHTTSMLREIIQAMEKEKEKSLRPSPRRVMDPQVTEGLLRMANDLGRSSDMIELALHQRQSP
ncbi:hypothetical protein LTS15_001873 [Exophiala xenobiotica]|nr:hypothetical protein LTS15_001873 [Exophiala xenobiotica]